MSLVAEYNSSSEEENKEEEPMEQKVVVAEPPNKEEEETQQKQQQKRKIELPDAIGSLEGPREIPEFLKGSSTYNPLPLPPPTKRQKEDEEETEIEQKVKQKHEEPQKKPQLNPPQSHKSQLGSAMDREKKVSFPLLMQRFQQQQKTPRKYLNKKEQKAAGGMKRQKGDGSLMKRCV